MTNKKKFALISQGKKEIRFIIVLHSKHYFWTHNVIVTLNIIVGHGDIGLSVL